MSTVIVCVVLVVVVNILAAFVNSGVDPERGSKIVHDRLFPTTGPKWKALNDMTETREPIQ